MFVFASYLCFLTVGIGAVFTIFLWLRFRKNFPRRFLMLLILAFCGIEFYMYALSSRTILDMPFLYRSAFPWRYVLGPLLWLYVLNMIKPDRGWKKIDVLHFLVPLSVTILLIPDYLLPGEQKKLILSKFYDQNTVLMTRSSGFLPAGFIQPFNIFHSLAYCAATIVLLVKYKFSQHHTTATENHEVWKWTAVVAAVSTIFVLFQFVQWLTLSIDSHFSIFAQIGQSLSLICMKAYLLINPIVMENMDGVIPEAAPELEPSSELILPQIKANSRYTQHASMIQQYLETEKKYLDRELTIGAMAEELGMSKSKLSMILVGLYGIPYTEIINRYRVHHFLEQMKRGDGQTLKLEVLIQNSGFQYRSTFYSAFKKITGKTPKGLVIGD